MEVSKTNTLSFYNDQGVLTLSAKQYDTGRKFIFNIINDYELYDLTGCSVYLRMKKADNTEFQGEECCTINENKIIVDTSVGNGDQILSCSGTNLCELHLTDSDGKSVTTWNFIINVEPRVHDGDGILSENSWDMMDSISDTIINLKNEKMDKTNPTGTGAFSLNRKSGSTVGTNSFAEGLDCEASGMVSHAEGSSTISSSVSSHAEGNQTTASWSAAHAEGNQTTASNVAAHAEGISTTASGEASHTEGQNTTASGKRSHAGGFNTTTTGEASHAEGYSVITASDAVAKLSGVFGEDITQLTGNDWEALRGLINDPTTEGYLIAHGRGSHAEGMNTFALGTYSHAEGEFTITNTGNKGSHAEGYGTGAGGNYSHAEGYKTGTLGTAIYSHAEGESTNTMGKGSHAEGYQTLTKSNADYSHVEGNGCTTFGKNSHAEGVNTTSLGEGSHAEGYSTKPIDELAKTYYGASTDITTLTGVKWATLRNTFTDDNAGSLAQGKYSHVEGRDNIADGYYTHAEGRRTYAHGKWSHSEGYGAESRADASHAEGYGAKTYGEASHAEGYNTNATGLYSHAEGYSDSIARIYTDDASLDDIISDWNNEKFSVAFGNSSHVAGSNCIAYGESSHAEGKETISEGMYSHAEGGVTTAFGSYSHTEGFGGNYVPSSITSSSSYDDILSAYNSSPFTLAFGHCSHAEGSSVIAYGDTSHAEGSFTKAYGDISHSEGGSTTASGYCSHAEGIDTIANGNFQHVQGKYNVVDTTSAFIIGNGTDDDNRSNALKVDWKGNLQVSGDVRDGEGHSLAVLSKDLPFPLAIQNGVYGYIKREEGADTFCPFNDKLYKTIEPKLYGNKVIFNGFYCQESEEEYNVTVI